MQSFFKLFLINSILDNIGQGLEQNLLSIGKNRIMDSLHTNREGRLSRCVIKTGTGAEIRCKA